VARKKAVPKEKGPVAPSRDEVLALPHWPRVAFCARVARRMLPLVAACWETEVEVNYLRLPGHVKGTRSCVRQTELAAAKAGVVSEDRLYAGHEAASVAGGQAEYAAQLAKRPRGSRPYAAAYAANAIDAAARGAFSRTKPDWNCEWGLVVANAALAGKALGTSAALNAALRADYETLKRLIAEKGWGDDTPVPPRVFGPLWPDGPPPGWPQDG
jgi:hypothetical protein